FFFLFHVSLRQNQFSKDQTSLSSIAATFAQIADLMCQFLRSKTTSDLDTIRVLVDRLQMDCILHLGKPQNSPSISNFSIFKTSRVTVKKVAPKGKAAKDPNKPKRPALAFFVFMFNLKKLTYDERKQKLIERLNALNAINLEIKNH
ncbi:hypothetical protein Ccrd_020871, partial [Cynara cardunculus var. scolymus]